MGFDPGFERPMCLATLKSSDRTKQSVCGWQYIYIYYIILYMCVYVNVWLNRTDTSCQPILSLIHSSLCKSCLIFLDGMNLGRHCFFQNYFGPQLKLSLGEWIMTWQTQWRVIYIYIYFIIQMYITYMYRYIMCICLSNKDTVFL